MNPDHKNLAIVIGASAGGLHTLSALLEGLPEDYSLPIIIVQHRSKDQKELLEHILQSKCRIRIKQVDEKERILKGIVYIAPPDYHLLIEKNETFSLSVDHQVKYSRPSIDVLFETAAETFKDKLVGIILTGTSNDGAAGMKKIKEFKGITIAQDPMEAQYPFMPEAAIEEGVIQFVLTVEKIQKLMLQLNDRGHEEK